MNLKLKMHAVDTVTRLTKGSRMDFTAKLPRKNPYRNANFISKILFLWIIPLFREGKQKDLNLDDLYDPLEDDLAGKMGDDLEA